ncbi:MAG: sn-glycerol-3-phosphate ABC transporter ATP-binding protein UgpC [Candidatus Omnitrophica bacterium]|nr:sn-glycerol-3-phosphate ABC transporter ATP-binding protein UgpC [Candidatus Omnitrophota bacterium]MDD5488150.1 sn-glycerol-3-phosphate ABC transporter ATP-binding protein UgpC [Candidatus Omnitrophota bacterium]
MAQVSLTNVVKEFPGGVKAVNDVSFGVENKEFIVLVGPSGCGKSTTLRLIAGLETMTSGDIFIGNRKVNNIPPKDRDIAMVFQNYALYPHMTVSENMAFGLKLRKYPKHEIDARVKEAAGILGLESLLNRRPNELSGGQRQRVAVGRAIVRKPLAFLFDEPLSNLDAKLRVQMRTELRRLHIRLQSTMIYVTHDQTEAMTLGDRIVVMKDGLIQQIDTPTNVYNSPVNKSVASFIGAPPMNFMEGKIIKKDGKLYFDEGNFRVKMVESMYDAVAGHIDRRVIMGIRSEDIYNKLFVSETPPENIVTMTCEVVEHMGSEVYIHMNTGKHVIVARMSGDANPQMNEDMDVVFDMSKIHFFDKTTEKTIV